MGAAQWLTVEALRCDEGGRDWEQVGCGTPTFAGPPDRVVGRAGRMLGSARACHAQG